MPPRFSTGLSVYATPGVLSRELVKETLNRHTNQYEKLANISYDKTDGVFRSDNMVSDDAVDVSACCRRAEELFELYQRCANRKQVETICINYLRSLEATPIITARLAAAPMVPLAASTFRTAKSIFRLQAETRPSATVGKSITIVRAVSTLRTVRCPFVVLRSDPPSAQRGTPAAVE